MIKNAGQKPILTAGANASFVDVALPLPLRQTFTYLLPPGLRDHVKKGARLLVPLGNRRLTGYAVGFREELDPALEIEEGAIKEIIELLDEEPLLTDEILQLTRWTADYYVSSWGEVLKASLPAGINASVEQVVSITEKGRDELSKISDAKTVKTKILQFLNENGETSRQKLSKNFGASPVQRAVRDLVKNGFADSFHRGVTIHVKPKRRKAVRFLQFDPNLEDQKPLTEAQHKIIDMLALENGEMLFTELLEKADVGASPINTLAKRGIVEIFVQEVRRDPLAGAKLPEIQKLTLTTEQTEALIEIEKSLKSEEYKAFLLHGITGSGKTEIYIRAMQAALKKERSALMLVPEIALTPVFSKQLRAIFGEEVAILHSNLSAGERFDEWRKIRKGDARIVIGTRSAVFAPLQNLGLIIVDEEHDSSYRQQESPFYNARDVAVVRANCAEAVVVLGSATPSLETFYNAQTGKYVELQLPYRIANRPLAKAEIVDMREVFKKIGKDTTLSNELAEAIRETHAKGEQTIILLNRRGFSQFVLCRNCGETIHCRNCDITLTFHKRAGKLICHYCNYRENVPKVCPECQSEYLYFMGEGTEQVENILSRKFPDLNVERFDRDRMSRRGEMENILERFSAGEIDMLVGTQMLAKGHDYPNVTLVGVISVDTTLALPDFRSAERTFQLLTQVAGRAGRGDQPGRVIIQTYYPENYVIRYANAQDYEGFYNEEIVFRKNFGFPPFIALAAISIKHSNYDYAFENAQTLKNALINANKDNMCRIFGVAPAPLSRLKGEYRLQILIKSGSRAKLRETLDSALHDAQKTCDMRIVSVEIDPVNLL
jgi:primosomal protein N' (replication factor Y)